MLKKDITFTNFDGEEKTMSYLFHLSKVELVRLEMEYDNGLEQEINDMVEKKDGRKILHFFERIIGMAYGEKSEDGNSFLKTDEITQSFMMSAAYEQLFEELVGDPEAAAAFVNGIVPKAK